MREILFRGKRKDGNGWAYGSLISIGDFCCILEPDAVRVDPETVGQYIGQTDANGEKVFEGDILEYTYPWGKTESVVITYDFCSFSYKTLENYDRDWTGDPIDDNEYGITTEYYHTIGNIHDNPEIIRYANQWKPEVKQNV